MNNFDEVIASRRSIRKYLNKDISDKDINAIINAGIMAPSAHNRQPWKISILKNKSKNEIGDMLLEKSSIDPSISNTANIIKEAPILLVILYDKTEGNRDNDILSLGAFIENMHLKATSLGLGSLWIANTNYIKDEISKYLNTNLECISCLSLGYKDQNPDMRPRKKLEDIIISI